MCLKSPPPPKFSGSATAKCILEKLEKDGDVNAKFFFKQTTCFYEKYESYLDVYRHAYEGVTSHLWLNSSEDLFWQPVCALAEKINSMFAKQIIDIDALFNEHVVVKNYNSASDRKERWKNTTISYEQKWTQLLQAFKDKDIPISNFQKLVEFVFCLPGTSAPVERIFSTMKNMWSDDRSSTHEKNVKALLVCKSNINLTCTEFYENIKSNVVLLKKVLGM